MDLQLKLRLLKARFSSRGFSGSFRYIKFWMGQFLEHSSPQKIGNLFLAKTSRALKLDRVAGMPFRYVIDPINTCNLRCPLCPTGLGILGRERGKMSLDHFQNLIDQVKPYAYLAELYNWGEPFLHPDLFEMIAYASERKIAVGLSTNLNHFNAGMAEKTVASGLDWMIVSIDGATQEVYETYRRFGSLDKVFKNLQLLVEAKRKAKSSKPFIKARTVVSKYNESQIEEIRRKVMEIGVDLYSVGPLYIDTTNPEQVAEWLPEKQEYSSYKYADKRLENAWDCADLWESAVISWDGGLAPCCWLHQKNNDYENAFARPLKEIWNGEAYVSSRRVFAFGGPKSGPVTTICTQCKGRPLYLKD